jgi:hypothetical protein
VFANLNQKFRRKYIAPGDGLTVRVKYCTGVSVGFRDGFVGCII